MKIVFVGTGSGKTSLSRFHSSLLIDSGDYRLLLDAGDGISKALLTLNIEINSIDGILFSHMHPDHSAGLPSLLVQMKMEERIKQLDIFSHPALKKNIEGILSYTHILPARLPFVINYVNFKERFISAAGEKIKFKPALNSHHEDLSEYQAGAVSCGFLFYLGKNIFFTGDIGSEEDLYLFKSEKVDIMISEKTHTNETEIKKAFKSLGARRLYLTHLTDDKGFSDAEEGMFSVWDGYEIEL